MEAASPVYRIRHCSMCLGTTEYLCELCICELCQQCGINHVNNLKFTSHRLKKYRDFVNIFKTGIYKYAMFSKYDKGLPDISCDWSHLNEYLNITKLVELYEIKKEHKITIHTLRNEGYFYRTVLLKKINADIKTCHENFSLSQSEMRTRAQQLKDLIDNWFHDVEINHNCLNQKREIKRYTVLMQKCEVIYEQSAIIPVQFLLSKKASSHKKLDLTLHTSKLFMTESLNKHHVMRSLIDVKITENETRKVDRLFQKMSVPKLTSSFTVKDTYGCRHVSCLTSHTVCIRDETELIMTNAVGNTLHRQTNVLQKSEGIHTVNNDGELIFIDKNNSIKKLSKYMNTTITLIERTDTTLDPWCVYWSPLTEDLLVGLYSNSTSKVARYNKVGNLTQSIQHDNTGLDLYKEPCYITENSNRDVVVCNIYHGSLFGSVVVTDHEGQHRFSYKRHPSGSKIKPHGICTDVMLHIIVCDEISNSVQLLDRDGIFLSHLLIRPSGIFKPYSLGYDINTNQLLVGSLYNNRICVYRYLTRQNTSPDRYPLTANVVFSRQTMQTADSTNKLKEDKRKLEMVYFSKLLYSFRVKDVHNYTHIVCVPPNMFWVSDGRYLNLTNINGDNLHSVRNYSLNQRCGEHTVNSEGELIYINIMDITQIRKDFETVTLVKSSHISKFVPLCVTCSPLNGDLLVGEYNERDSKKMHSKVVRYKKIGHLAQNNEYDNTGVEIYSILEKAAYITENTNGDIVLSCYVSVVVNNSRGQPRFTYTGHPSGSELKPQGISTDAFSHILVCDRLTNSIHLLDKNGQFLSQLLIKPSRLFEPQCLGIDVSSRRIYIGTNSELVENNIYVYSYLTREATLTDSKQIQDDEFESGLEIQNTKTEARFEVNEYRLSLMLNLKLKGAHGCRHISCTTSNMFWVSDNKHNLFLTNISGETLYHLRDLWNGSDGVHTINTEHELIYIENNGNIKKLSKDMNTITEFVEQNESIGRPHCLYCSPLTDDLLVGMRGNGAGKVVRYNQTGQQTQTIQYDNTRLDMYSIPNYITENNNGDVVVSDADAVVVTHREGSLRFVYTGYPSGSGLKPLGVCTDAQSHIIICDQRTNTIQMIDNDGNFLSQLLSRPLDSFKIQSLSFNTETNFLWVGSEQRLNNSICVYSIITEQGDMTDEYPHDDVLAGSISA